MVTGVQTCALPISRGRPSGGGGVYRIGSVKFTLIIIPDDDYFHGKSFKKLWCSQGFFPPPLMTPPIAMVVLPVPSFVLSQCALSPPTGDWWHKRGALHFKTIGFLQSSYFFLLFILSSKSQKWSIESISAFLARLTRASSSEKKSAAIYRSVMI